MNKEQNPLRNEDVAVLILNYNQKELTVKCVNQLLKLDPAASVVVVDNHSPDQSFEFLRDTYKDEPAVSVIESDTNGGYAKGNNFGLKYIESQMSQIKYVIVMNPDILISDGNLIYTLKEALFSKPEYGALSCQIVFNNQWRGFTDFGWAFPSEKHLLWAGTFAGKILLSNVNNAYESVKVRDEIADVDIVSGCFFMARMEDLKKVGYLCEDTFLYFEESILAKKLLGLNKREGIVLNKYVEHNHQLKDQRLKNYKKKLFDREQFHKSKMVYINKFSDLNGTMKTLCGIVNSFDLFLKKILYGGASIIFHG